MILRWTRFKPRMPLIGLSVDSLYAHIAWLRKIQPGQYCLDWFMCFRREKKQQIRKQSDVPSLKNAVAGLILDV